MAEMGFQHLANNLWCVVYLFEMALKDGIVAFTVTFQAFRRITIMCIQLENVPLLTGIPLVFSRVVRTQT